MALRCCWSVLCGFQDTEGARGGVRLWSQRRDPSEGLCPFHGAHKPMFFGFVSFRERRECGVGIVWKAKDKLRCRFLPRMSVPATWGGICSKRQASLQIPPQVAGTDILYPSLLPTPSLDSSQPSASLFSPLTGSQPLPHFPKLPAG